MYILNKIFNLNFLKYTGKYPQFYRKQVRQEWVELPSLNLPNQLIAMTMG